jgi:hypothetical protein
VRRFLAALPPKFEQIAMSIETLCDLDTITVDELIERLKPSEERINCNQGKSVASLNLTEDELVARLSSRLKMTGNGGGDRHKESSSGGGKRGRGRGGGRGSSSGGHGGSSYVGPLRVSRHFVLIITLALFFELISHGMLLMRTQ